MRLQVWRLEQSLPSSPWITATRVSHHVTVPFFKVNCVYFGNYFKTTYFSSVVSLLASLEKKVIEIGFVDSESIDKLKKQTEIKINFDVIANVPLYKNINQNDYSIVKLKKEEI